MGQITLFSADNEEDQIDVEVSSGYDVMLNELEDKYDVRADMIDDITSIIEATIYQEAQQQNTSPELHKAFAELIRVLESTGEIDTQALVESSIHELNQAEADADEDSE